MKLKSLHQESGSIWFVDLSVLPFIRRVELFQSWHPFLMSGSLLSGAAIAFVSLLDTSRPIPDWVKIGLILLALLFIASFFLLYIKLPVSKKHKELYRDLTGRGIVLTEKGMQINVHNVPDRKITWDEIDSFHITIMESSNNAEFLTFHRADETISFPFIQLTRADRVPIPNIVEHEGQLYYCYSAEERVPLIPENNDFYREVRDRIGRKESSKRLERLSFQCPYCDESFVLYIHNWRLRKRDVLFCDLCPRLVTMSHESPRYQLLFEQKADEGTDTVLDRTDELITFRGLVSAEPDQYTFEILQGSTEEIKIIDRRGPDFQKAIEDALKPCPCGGRFSYQAHPRCPQCNHTLKDLVNGLGYGRYAVLTEELPGEKMWHAHPEREA